MPLPNKCRWSDTIQYVSDLNMHGKNSAAIRSAILLILRSDPKKVYFTEPEHVFIGKLGQKYFSKQEILRMFGKETS